MNAAAARGVLPSVSGRGAAADAATGHTAPLGGAVEFAVAFLAKTLDHGALAVETITRRARAAGISEPTLRRAKTALGVKARKTTEGPWQWELREGAQTLSSKDAQSRVSHRQSSRPAEAPSIDASAFPFATRGQHDRIRELSARVGGLPVSGECYAEATGRRISELRTVTTTEAAKWIAALEKRAAR